jgi:hypothetical protein
MEIDVTSIKKLDCRDFSNSVANSGLQNIGQITYKNACKYFDDNDLLVSVEDRKELEEWILDFGAWDQDEIDSWNDKEINALLLHFIASEINEYEDAEKQGCLEEWDRDFGGRLFESDGSWYFYIGN